MIDDFKLSDEDKYYGALRGDSIIFIIVDGERVHKYHIAGLSYNYFIETFGRKATTHRIIHATKQEYAMFLLKKPSTISCYSSHGFYDA